MENILIDNSVSLPWALLTVSLFLMLAHDFGAWWYQRIVKPHHFFKDIREIRLLEDGISFNITEDRYTKMGYYVVAGVRAHSGYIFFDFKTWPTLIINDDKSGREFMREVNKKLVENSPNESLHRTEH